MVKERPILFSAPMVRAILEDRKTQTRRIVKPQPPSKYWLIGTAHTGQDVGLYYESGKWRMTGAVGVCREAMGNLWPKNHEWKCPYGTVGDRLWVRETWCHAADDNDRFKYNADGNLDNSCCHFRADGYEVMHIDREETKAGLPKSPWRPSIHMPRWASRITLEITGVRVERLKEISEQDAIAEGVKFGTGQPRECRTCGRGAFMDLWESINGTDSWAANPWVWVVKFKRVQQ